MTRKFSLLLALFMCMGVIQTSFAQSNNLKIQAKPKDMWELGIHVGHSIITGDVDWDSDFGVGLHLRKALDHTFSIRLDGGYYRFSGTEEDDARPVDAGIYGFPTNWVPEYSATQISGDISVVASLNQFKIFKKNKINPYLFAGLGIASLSSDAINGGTEVDVADSRNFDDEWNVSPYGAGGIGLGFLLGKKVSLSLEHKITKIFGRGADLLDGVEFQGTPSDVVITPSDDLLNYTSVRVGIALGKGDDKSMPLWWVSPLDLMAEDLAEVKARPVLDMTDTDGDGVIDMIDQEKDTEKDCPVDTRGVMLDSDSDGIADCKDSEPYSPPGYKVDAKGVADVPDPGFVNETEVNNLIDSKLATWTPSTPMGISDWFLPMVHFNLDKYSIKGTEYGKLHNVATVMKNNPSVRVVAKGYTDQLSGNCYNDVLSYNRANAVIDYLVSKYGIARDRFVLNWGGENDTLVPTSGGNLINRRVEFMVATDQTEMARPDCGVQNAGSGGSTKYSGNKEAGY